MEILPAIDLRGGQCVRLRQGDYDRETVFSADPAEVADQWVSQGATRIHIVDLDGARAGEPVNHELVRNVVSNCDIPCQFGGGVRTEESITLLLETVGVERVVIGTQALKQPDWFRGMVARFPGRLALGIDARDSFVATEGWKETSKTSALELARVYERLDIAALIYTNIANDGMMNGIDDGTLDDLEKFTELGLPIIASGGVTTVEDIRRLAEISRRAPTLVGAIVGRALYEGAVQLPELIETAR